MKSEIRDHHRFVFWMILTFAAMVRLKGLASGLPLHTLYGENDTLSVLQQMLYTGNLNPNSFAHPGLSYYLYLPFLYGFYWIGVWSGHFNEITSVPQASLIFVGRLVCALLGTATVVLLYRIGLHFGRAAALTAMAILASSPQHIEFSHVLRPEIPALFFAIAVHLLALSLTQKTSIHKVLFLGLLAGASFSIKYNIGLPLIFVLFFALWLNRKNLGALSWIILPIGFVLTYVATNPFLVLDQPTMFQWIPKLDSFDLPAEDYHGKNIGFFYLMYLIRYNYQIPLIVVSFAGLLIAVYKYRSRAILISVYPIALFVWLCFSELRRIQELLPLHPFLGLWAGIALQSAWNASGKSKRSHALTAGYLAALILTLYFPYHRALTQSFLYSKTDNRSKAELWITNHLPQGSKIALLQFHQIELDPRYFEVENFEPRDYLAHKDFNWFKKQNFDYVVVSSGQYMRYFIEGSRTQPFKNYFQSFFAQAATQGTLVLDLTTHPTLIPDYRIKVFSTKGERSVPEFLPAVVPEYEAESIRLSKSGSALSLSPGYYSLQIPPERSSSYFIRVQNLKFNETILQKSNSYGLQADEKNSENFPFAILPERLTSDFSLFSHAQPDVTPNQHVQFEWKGIPAGIHLSSIPPPLEILTVSLEMDQKQNLLLNPFLLLNKAEELILKCDLANRSQVKVTGHAEAFLSEVGESQPWKSYELGSDIQEYVLEPGQVLPIEIPLTTNNLTGDYELSFWIFTRQDLPFVPQNGSWFNKQIRVDDPKLGIHPVYGIPIP